MSSAFNIFVRQSIREADEGKFVTKTLAELRADE